MKKGLQIHTVKDENGEKEIELNLNNIHKYVWWFVFI